MSSSGLVFTSDTLTPSLRKAALGFGEKVDALLEFESEHVQDFMRNNAPWTDRTANARGGLFARNASEGATHSIVCYHTVPYGIWLEVRFSGRYAIIQPTIEHEGRRIMGVLRTLLKKLAA